MNPGTFKMTDSATRPGGYELFSSAHRVVSVGSRQFVCASNSAPAMQLPRKVGGMPPFGSPFGMAPMRLEDCHVRGWTGAAAVEVDGMLQVIDCSFKDPVRADACAVTKARVVDGTSPQAEISGFPALLSNSTVTLGLGRVIASETKRHRLSFTPDLV